MAKRARVHSLKKALQKEIGKKVKRLRAHRSTVSAGERKDVNLEIAVHKKIADLLTLTFNTRSCKI